MTLSLVAVVTDVMRDGRTVVGYGFNSNGRYGQGGLIRERFAPRLAEADPKSLLNDAGDNLDPDRIWATLMKNEKPGGHGERSVAVGTIDMAVWDAVAKIAGKPLFRLLAERHKRAGRPARLRLCGRRLLLSGQGHRAAARRDAQLSRPRLHGREDEDRQRDRRGPAAHRGRARGARRQGAARGRRQRPPRPRRGHRLRQDAAGLSAVLVRGGRRPARLRAAGRARRVLSGPMATGENLFSHQDARNLLRYGGMRPDRDWLQFDCALSYGLCEYQRTLAVVGGRRLVAAPLHPARRTPDVAQHRGRPRPRRQRELSRPVPALSAASPTACASRTATSSCRSCRASASRASRTSSR